jgi:16S rRNA (cytosine1402-N4)-methyltransferase
MAQDTDAESFHRAVMVEEVVDLMSGAMPGLVIDATFGGGGHTRRLIEEFGDRVRVIAIDRDPEAVANAEALGVTAIRGDFADMATLVPKATDESPSAVLFDFGVSSHQLDEPERGFSYRHDGPLDMRMGPDTALTANEIVNEWSSDSLTAVIRKFGEEPMAARIATAIVAARPITSTTQLSTVIAEAMPAARRRAGHPARRTFQALRIAVNGELDSVETGLDAAIRLIRPEGRIVAISYHSLEDRIVKRRFTEGATGCVCPPGLPVCGCGRSAELRLLTRRPLRASESEVASNRRSRSAVLRAAEKVSG